jgi:hypothetical protein
VKEMKMKASMIMKMAAIGWRHGEAEAAKGGKAANGAQLAWAINGGESGV